jgi:hypothetical protein
VPLTHLLAAVPDWFKVTGITATEILGSTSLHFDNAVGIIEVDLRIHEGEVLISTEN